MSTYQEKIDELEESIAHMRDHQGQLRGKKHRDLDIFDDKYDINHDCHPEPSISEENLRYEFTGQRRRLTTRY